MDNGVEKSLGRFMWGAMRSPLTMIRATLRGYVPMTLSMSKMSTLPVDILIDEDGKVVEAHYCKATVDHMPIDRMIAFSNGECSELWLRAYHGQGPNEAILQAYSTHLDVHEAGIRHSLLPLSLAQGRHVDVEPHGPVQAVLVL